MTPDIITLDNGKQYVEATRQVITGSDLRTMRKDISAFFKEMLKNGPVDIVATNGDVLTISKETARKARDNYYQENKKRKPLSDELFNVKINAEAHIDEISEVSKANGKPKTDEKAHDFAESGFTYRDAYFKDFDGKYYKITLSVGNKNGTSTIYNVTPQKNNLPSGNIVSRTRSKPLGKLSIDSISQPETIVNPKFSKETLSADEAVALNSEADRRRAADSIDFDLTTEGKARYNISGSNNEQYRVMWTAEEGLLDNKEIAAFYSKISELNNNKYKTFIQLQNGEYIFEINDKLVFTDGEYYYPEISKVISFSNMERFEIDMIKELIYNATREGAEIQEFVKVIQDVYGQENVTITNQSIHDYPSFESQIGGRSGSDIIGVNPQIDTIENTDQTETLKGTRFFDAQNKGNEPKYSKDILSAEEAAEINERNSQLYESLTGKDVSYNETKGALEADKERFKYSRLSNAATYAKARRYVNERGIQNVIGELTSSALDNKLWNADDMARAEYIFTQLQKQGKTSEAVNFAVTWTSQATKAGQAVQAMAILNRLTPEGKLLYITRTAEKATQDNIEKHRFKKGEREQFERD